MGHEDAGHYARKHPGGASPSPVVADRLKRAERAGEVSCSDAHTAARALGVTPAEVGRCMDLMELRIARCQLGLFGHAPARRIVRPAERVTPGLETAIRSRLVGGRLPCEAAWLVAEEAALPRLAVAGACEALGVKIKPCQLGAF